MRWLPLYANDRAKQVGNETTQEKCHFYHSHSASRLALRSFPVDCSSRLLRCEGPVDEADTVSTVMSTAGLSWITNVTRETLALTLRLGSRMNSTRLDRWIEVGFDYVQSFLIRKTSQTTLCLLRFSAGQDMLTQEDKRRNWNSRLVEEVEVDCTRSLACDVKMPSLPSHQQHEKNW